MSHHVGGCTTIEAFGDPIVQPNGEDCHHNAMSLHAFGLQPVLRLLNNSGS